MKINLQNLDLRKADVGGETFEHFMFRAAQALKGYIEDEYYRQRELYDPKVYERDRHSVPWKEETD